MTVVYPQFAVPLFTSRTWAMPLAVMEAMACKLRVVATNVGRVVDMIERERTGWLVRPVDPDDLADRGTALVSAPALAHGAADSMDRERPVRAAPGRPNRHRHLCSPEERARGGRRFCGRGRGHAAVT